MSLPRGVRSLDVEIQAFLTEGVEFLRSNPEVLDEVFRHFQEPHLEALYGNKELNKAKQWFLSNKLAVIQSWSLAPDRVPCISIHQAAANEQVSWSYFGDHAETAIESASPSEIVSDFVPADYDPDNGIVTINPNTTDISNIRPGHILVDAKGEQFLIIPVIDLENNFFTIDTTEGSDLDTRSAIITDSVNYVKKKYGQGEFHENIDLGLHGKESDNTVLWIYYLVVWLLFRFKSTLESRGVDIHTFSASEFDRQSKFVQEHIYSRWIRMSGKTTVEWSEEPLPVASQFDVDVDVDES